MGDFTRIQNRFQINEKRFLNFEFKVTLNNFITDKNHILK